MHATIKNDSLKWGVPNDSDQVVLSYPAIGLATVDLSTGTHITCCLRGGTVYLVPESDELQPITVILSQVDTEVEPPMKYLQGFTAGNVRVDGIKSSADKELAVLVYSLAGGILKVYACELLAPTEEDSVLLELVKNGSAQFLRDLLFSVEDDDPLLSASEAWKRSREEVMQADDGALTAETLRSPSFIHTRQVLMELSEVDGSTMS